MEEDILITNIKLAQSLVDNDSLPSLRKNVTSEERAKIFR